VKAWLVLSAFMAALLGACDDAALRPVVRDPARSAPSSCGDCAFPEDPIVVPAPGGLEIPSDIGERFGAPGSGAATGGPCLVEPQLGSLFPSNWLRPRFRWNPPAVPTYFELRLSIDLEPRDLVVYTSSTSWIMDRETWASLLTRAAGRPIAVSLRSLSVEGAAPALGSSGTFSIAPVQAPGSIVYWSIKAETEETFLKGFQVGSESVATVVRPTAGRCVGCHASTPDGEYVAYSDADLPEAQGQFASVALRSLRDGVSEPTFLTSAGRALLARRNQHLAAFSPAHWRAGDRVALSLLNLRLVWTDLEAISQEIGVGSGPLVLDGDPGGMPAWPSWSHDGSFVVYSSGQGTIAGGILTNADIYRVPYDERRGGTALPILGASDPAWNEFYPALSPDDRLVAFSRVRVEDGDSYDNRHSEVFVVSTDGGEPVRIDANDPGPCQGSTSPGATNSWPRWSPDATVTGGKTYYWLTFSSTRAGGVPQLYVTPVIRLNDGVLETYPALYLWNQPPTEGNHTPAWDSFQIPFSSDP
jgi:hypothetical protein